MTDWSMSVSADEPQSGTSRAHPTGGPQRRTGNGEPSDGNGRSGVDPAKRRRFILFAGVVVVIVLAASFLWWLHERNYQSTDDAYVDARMVQLSPQIPGRVVHVYAQDNRRVHAGELLVELDPAEYQARLAQAQAQAAQADAQLTAAQAQVQVSAASYQQAQASVASATAQAANAERDFRRYRGLQRTAPSAVAAQQLDQARTQAVNTASQRTSALKQVVAAAAQMQAARSQIALAQAQRKAAQAQVVQARLDLGYARITAPCDGTVANRTVAVGDYLQPGQDALAIVPFAVWITANFKETQLSRMRPGDPVDIEIDAYPGVKFTGHVDSIQRGAGQAFSVLPAQNATGNFVKVVQRVPVKILIDGPRGSYVLGPGMSVSPRVRVR